MMRYFKALNILNKKLILEFCDYIETGKNEEQIITLAQQNQLDFIEFFDGRRPLLSALGYKWQPLAYVRLAKILANLTSEQNAFYALCGTTDSPFFWRYTINLALLLCSRHSSYVIDQCHENYFLTAPRFLELAQLSGVSSADILDILLTQYYCYGFENLTYAFTGIEQWFHDQRHVLAPLISQANPEKLSQFLNIARQLHLADDYLDILIHETMNGAKKNRNIAILALASANKTLIKDKLLLLYPTQSSTKRILLIMATIAIFEYRAIEILKLWLNDEHSTKPKSTLEQQLSFLNINNTTEDEQAINGQLSYKALDGTKISALPCAFDNIEKQRDFSKIDKKYYQDFAEVINNYNKTTSYVIDCDKYLSEFEHIMNGGDFEGQPLSYLISILLRDRQGRKALEQCICDPSLSLFQILIFWKSTISNFPNYFFSTRIEHKIINKALISKIKEIGDWRAFDRIIVQQWQSPTIIEICLANKYSKQQYFNQLQDYIQKTSKDAFWPMIMDNAALLDQALGLAPIQDQKQYFVENALLLLKMLPQIPMRYATVLTMIATGQGVSNSVIKKPTKLLSRELLNGMPKLNLAIAKLLQDGQQNVRASAAAWLASRDAKSEIPALKAFLKKEKHEIVRAAFLSALEQLKVDISNFLAPKILLLEANNGLAKTKIKTLEWFPFDQIPQAHWKNGDIVDPIILQWWVTLAAKLKQPKGNAMMDLWLDQLKPEDANQFGLFIAQAWFAYDTPTYGGDEANILAAEIIKMRQMHITIFANHYTHYNRFSYLSDDLLFEKIRQTEKGNYKNSGADAKGILALTTRVKGTDIANLGANYLKKHSKRVSQAKAIIDILVKNRSPAAIQVVVNTANRTKQQSVQDYAKQAAEEIADKNGWTLEELAERTIPTAGLDENGEAELECGNGRIFKLKLNQSGALILLNDEGKEVKSLPNAKGDNKDDIDLITEAKKFIIDAKKELKQVFTFQTARLFEAMCFERLWSTADWQTYIFNHPIMRHIVTKLIWIGVNQERKQQIIFRPLDDGSFTGVNDAEITLTDFTAIKLAHANLVGEQEAAAWRKHLSDYEIKPAFKQLRVDLPIIPDELEELNEIDDRKGYMIDSIQLQKAAYSYGYERGTIEEYGYFYSYRRRYPSVNLVAQIYFTGSPLPETNMPTAITHLSFADGSGNDYHTAEVIALKDVPPVLLVETLADYHAIAASGTGFDPDWQKKTSF